MAIKFKDFDKSVNPEGFADMSKSDFKKQFKDIFGGDIEKFWVEIRKRLGKPIKEKKEEAE